VEKLLYLVLHQLDEVWGVHKLRGLRESGWEDIMLTGHNKHYTMGLFEG
jgi:hypothetical protein